MTSQPPEGLREVVARKRMEMAADACRIAAKATDLGAAQAFALTALDILTLPISELEPEAAEALLTAPRAEASVGEEGVHPREAVVARDQSLATREGEPSAQVYPEVATVWRAGKRRFFTREGAEREVCKEAAREFCRRTGDDHIEADNFPELMSWLLDRLRAGVTVDFVTVDEFFNPHHYPAPDEPVSASAERSDAAPLPGMNKSPSEQKDTGQ